MAVRLGAVVFVEQVVHVQRQFGARIEAVTRHDVGDGVGFLAAVVGGAGFGGGVGDAERGRVGVGFALPAHACADGPAAGGFGGKVVGSEEFEAADHRQKQGYRSHCVADLANGKISKFTIDTLLNMPAKTGKTAELNIRA